MSKELSTPIAYTINNPALPEPFVVKKTANGWWADGGKLYAILLAFKVGATIEEACDLAMITIDQYKYFVQQHPEFSDVKARFQATVRIQALFTISRNIHKPGIAWKMLKALQPARFGSPSERLYWAKRAVFEPDEEGKELANKNIEMARELLRSGETAFFR